MDYGVQLGRRFRALKMWWVLRAFGLEGVRERIRHHVGLAQSFARRYPYVLQCDIQQYFD